MNYPVNVVVDHYGVEILSVQYISIHIGTYNMCICMSQPVSLSLSTLALLFKTDTYSFWRAMSIGIAITYI